MTRLAKLIPDENGITDIHRQGTYTGGMFPFREWDGALPIERLYSGLENLPLCDKYESVCIRMTSGFDD